MKQEAGVAPSQVVKRLAEANTVFLHAYELVSYPTATYPELSKFYAHALAESMKRTRETIVAYIGDMFSMRHLKPMQKRVGARGRKHSINWRK
jgi:hypothetical protein